MPKQTRKQSIKGKSAISVPVNSTKLRPMVQCYCKKCNGDLVETRTRNVHEAEEYRLQESIERLKRDREKKKNKYKIHNLRSSKSISECDHVEFLNYTLRNQREPCETELLKRVPVVNGYIWKPKMIYPLPCLKTQLSIMYQRPGFDELLKKWTNQDVTGLMSDIYDGEIWKNFPSQLDAPESKFFTAGTADSHLGIMINLDWFQPFESSIYSCRMIYGVICNLSCDIRFKKENMLILGLLPEPHEPIVNELLEFNDIPAERKLCGHISVLAGCHRCYKRASSKNGERANFGGFEDMPNWFKMRDPEEHRHNAILWKYKLTKEDRKQHVRATYVRHLIVDSMHCLFLGIVHWIVKKIWIDGGKLTKSHLKIMESHDPDQKILANFVRAGYLLVAQLIENIYGPEMITPNIHLSLHISECCRDYGPLYSFWYYSFERMNGLLGK
ncbi:hypothetical protein RhiirA5_389857 [Rhizophagus irregularis]|uniref:Transposase domain-containing protein n=1 Tax=Rhizophagus irregularis TaxID=588596 RepID=A0A2N0PKJ9_9GLOM|nr:hypothetical protein RhiirA5_389857 [Rhizophagus irregularis]